MDFLEKIMKIKPLYLYGVLGIIIIVILIISIQQVNENSESFKNFNNMPPDDIHKGLNNSMNQNPGSSNVTAETKLKLEELRIAYEKNPDDSVKLLEYADFLLSSHRPDEAIPLYEKLLRIDPLRIDAMFALTSIYYDKADFDKAEELTNKVLKVEPDNVMALYNLGAINATKGNKGKAREIWTKIINEYPDSETKELAKNSLSRLNAK